MPYICNSKILFYLQMRCGEGGDAKNSLLTNCCLIYKTPVFGFLYIIGGCGDQRRRKQPVNNPITSRFVVAGKFNYSAEETLQRIRSATVIEDKTENSSSQTSSEGKETLTYLLYPTHQSFIYELHPLKCSYMIL